MKINAIRTLSGDEIIKELQALYKKTAVSSLLKHTARDQKMNTASQSAMKKTIARLLTVQKERVLTGDLSS